MKHEDDMTMQEYRRWKKAEHDDDRAEHDHSHICDVCEAVWLCPQLWHCRRDEKSTCADCLVKE